jgi:hypothetical protein
MQSHLSAEARTAPLTLRCECGALIGADRARSLVELTRMHIGEFHPDIDSNVPADLILAMAEKSGRLEGRP